MAQNGPTCISKVYDVWARSLLMSTLVSFNPCLPEMNATLSSHGWHARRSLLWHRRHKTLYDRSSRCPMSRGGCHSSRTDVWLTTETTLRGAEGTPRERWLDINWQHVSSVCFRVNLKQFTAPHLDAIKLHYGKHLRNYLIFHQAVLTKYIWILFYYHRMSGIL